MRVMGSASVFSGEGTGLSPLLLLFPLELIAFKSVRMVSSYPTPKIL